MLYNCFMKKILSILLLGLCFGNIANAAETTTKKDSFFERIKSQKETLVKAKQKSYVSKLYSVTKFFAEYEHASNNYNKDSVLNCYSANYLSCDGFNLEILSKVISDNWKSYPGMKYDVKVNHVKFYKDLAIVDVSEYAKGYAKTEDNHVAEFNSEMQTIYYIQPKGKSWQIVGDYNVRERIILAWGDAKSSEINLVTPTQIVAGKEFSAILKVKQPEGVIAIGSISADKIVYPQQPVKEIFRKLSAEGTIERLMNANIDNVDEYVSGTVGFTRPSIDINKNLNINLSGYACIMERVRVVKPSNTSEVIGENSK